MMAKKVAFTSKKKPGPRKGQKQTKPKKVAFTGEKPKKRSWKPRGTCACCKKERVLAYMARYCGPCAIDSGKMCPKCRIPVGGKIVHDRTSGMYICKNCSHSWPAKGVKCAKR